MTKKTRGATNSFLCPAASGLGATVVLGTLKPDDGGVIAVGKNGAIETVYSTPAMLRGMADASGRFDVRVWN